MSDIPTYEDLTNYRYDSFDNKVTPKKIGYGSNPPESRIIPATAPYSLLLHEAPQQNTPSTTQITDTTTSNILEEVSKTTVPGNNQYRVNYDERGLGQVQFNSSQAGHNIEIKYYGEGSIEKVENYQSILDKTSVAPDIIGALYISGGDIILEKSRINGNTYSQQNLGAINIQVATEWYFVVFDEDAQTFTTLRMSTTAIAGWSPVLANNKLDMFALYDDDKYYCRFTYLGDNYRVLYVYKANAIPNDFATGSVICIKDKPMTVIYGQNVTLNLTTVLQDVTAVLSVDLLSEFDGTSRYTVLENGEYEISSNINGMLRHVGGSTSNLYVTHNYGDDFTAMQKELYISEQMQPFCGLSIVLSLKSGDVIYTQARYSGATVSIAQINRFNVSRLSIRRII